MRPEENVGPNYQTTQLMEARELAIELTQTLAHSFSPGIRESEAHQELKRLLSDRGITKLWHPSKIRFAENTLCTFKEESKSDPRLGMGELFYIDIGPVWQNHEGDYGETFRCGGGSDPLIEATRQVFKRAERAWRELSLTGEDLFNLASQEARHLGFKLDRRSAGHRCGDFPHALHHKGKLFDFNHRPKAGLWILEIHLIDEVRERGAFFEDVLGVKDLKG